MSSTNSKRAQTAEKEVNRRVKQELRRSHVAMAISEGAAVLNTLIRWGFPCVLGIYASYALAGKYTNIKVEGLFSAFANQWIYLSVAALTGGGWYVERRALRRRIKELSDEKKTLETILDSNRSSSGLAATGEPQRA